MKLKEFFYSMVRWTQGWYGISEEGEYLDIEDLMTTKDLHLRCACLTGAIVYFYGNKSTEISQLVKERLGFPMSVDCWNDAPERTFADIQKLVNELDI